MTKNLLKASLWGILTFSIFYSCRSDSTTTEQTIASKEKIAAFERFEKENNIIKPIASNDLGTNSTKYVSYSYPFALIIYNFLQTHPDYTKQIEKEVGTIRLDAVSQTFGKTEKSVIFPVTNNEGKVVAVWAGVINENRDYVTFYSLNRNTQEINTIKTAFQNYYDQKESRLANNAVASIKGLNPIAGAQVPPKDPPVREKDIPEVVINVPAVPERDIDPWWYKGPGGINYGTNPGGGMSGGSDVHGGGGNGTPSDQQKDACTRIKKILENPKFKEKFQKLTQKEVFDKDHEIGAFERFPPKENTGIAPSFADVENYINTTDMDLPADKSGIVGLLHSHNNEDKNGNKPIKIFSPTDVRTFLNILMTQSNNYTGSYQNAYSVVTTSEGSYMLKYTKDTWPTPADGGKYDLDRRDKWNEWYKKEYTNLLENGELTQENVEKIFTQFLSEVVKADGLEVYKVTETASSKLEYNGANNPVKTTSC
ncbi:hypothetical protein [Elizabethkingia ursingii]|uniref:Uncharacterized protein n=1 Tax=Elizabethkingia ursingii TaxID=1756150 RepID=A0ABX3N836_9FLAO|nr:hypothetical protein [Elizabethkingia ursingii]OPB87028.1 hypothetical protein BB021_10980 [Elizabethkingia ursingii]